MAEASLEHVGHGFEAAMRMVGRAAGRAGRVLDGPHFVEQQERVEVHQQPGGERAVNLETAAFGRA